MVGYEIDVYRIMDEENAEFDIKLDDFVKSGELEGWVVEELKKIGCDYAKSVLALSDEELEIRSDLEMETIKDVRAVLAKEFTEESK